MNVYQKQILLPLYKNALFNVQRDGRAPIIKQAFRWPWQDQSPWFEDRGYNSSSTSGSSSTASPSASGSPADVAATIAASNGAGGFDRDAFMRDWNARFGNRAGAAAAPAAGGAPVRRRRRRRGGGGGGGFFMEMPGMRMGFGGGGGRRRRRRRDDYYYDDGPAPAAAAGAGGLSADEVGNFLADWMAAHQPAAPTPPPAPDTPPPAPDTPPPAPDTPPAPELRYTEDDLNQRRAEIDAEVDRDRRWRDQADEELNGEIADRDANRRAWKWYRNTAPMLSFGGAALGGALASNLYDRFSGKTFKDRTWGDWWLRTGLTGLGAAAGFAGGAYLNRLRRPEDLSRTPIAHR